MELIGGVVVVMMALYFIISGNKKGKSSGHGKPSHLSKAEASLATFNEHKAWLSSRWSEANRHNDAGDRKTFPSWFFHEATERQLNLLTEKGISLSGGQLSKGQASDVIGLLFPVEEGDKQVLRFFEIPTKGLNQTTARAEVAKLQADPEKALAWGQRPAEPIQREFYKFFGVKVPSGLTYLTADEYISKHQQSLESQQLDDWNSYKSILDELMDKDTRDSYDIKKPSIATIRAAIEVLRQAGMSLSDLEEDLEIVTQKLIELKPELEKKY
ncbi:MAG: hypothetical protein H0X43_13280 [Nitrosospira sp.]|nr:hypothetical protein [Nitrosospira sp.]